MTFIDGTRVTKTPQRRRVVCITVQTDKPSASARTCSVKDCRRAEQMAGCSTLWDRGSWSCAGRLTSTLLAAPHIQSMQTIDEDDLGHSPLVSILPVDRREQHHGYISTQGPPSWKRSSAAPEASGGCARLVWYGPGVEHQRLTEPQRSGLIEAVSPGCQLFLPAERCISPSSMYKCLYQRSQCVLCQRSSYNA